jgi:serine/threonine-protein kinase
VGIEQLGTIWPEWSVVEKIGEGSFGKVYKVVREDSGFYSAVKVISIPKSSNEHEENLANGIVYDATSSRTYYEGIVADFRREIKMMVDMKSAANIVSIEDYREVERSDSIGWDIFIRMELLKSFKEYTANKELTEEEAINFGQAICSALEACASKGIIHRDIKPENIFITPFGEYKVGDFGIARELDKDGSIMLMTAIGAPNYVAPEVIKTGVYGKAVDIYSLGLVLYKVLNKNRLPFIDPSNPLENRNALSRRLRGDALPPPSEASLDMVDVILTACQYEPSLRYKTAKEFWTDLESVKNGTKRILPIRPQPAPIQPLPEFLSPPPIPPPPPPPLQKMTGYKKLSVVAGVTFICWLIAGIMLYIS